jgi:hypothetical protein
MRIGDLLGAARLPPRETPPRAPANRLVWTALGASPMSRIPHGPAVSRQQPAPQPQPGPTHGAITIVVIVLVLITALTVRGYPPYTVIGLLAAASAAIAEILRHLGLPPAQASGADRHRR